MSQLFILEEKKWSKLVRNLFQTINSLDKTKSWAIKISRDKTTRSARQNALYWKWLSQIEAHTNNDKDDIHFQMKEKFLVRIFMRRADYAEMIIAIKNAKSAFGDSYETTRKQVIELTSTTNASVEEMSEYLEMVEREWRMKGVDLVIPQIMGLQNY